MRTEEEERELREAAEQGRRYGIAADVLKNFLDGRREEIVQALETGNYENDGQLINMLVELGVIKRFKDLCRMHKDLGEIAEKELSKRDGD